MTVATYKATPPTLVDGANQSLLVDATGNLKIATSSTGTAASPSTGVESVQGNAASGATDTGNPVKVGGVFNTTAPTLTNGQRGNAQVNNRGAQLVEQGPFLAARVTADGQVKGSAGLVHTISIAPTTAIPTAGLLSVYDSLTETGTILYSEWVFASAPGHTITLDLPFATGLYIGYDATLTNVSVAVSYR